MNDNADIIFSCFLVKHLYFIIIDVGIYIDIKYIYELIFNEKSVANYNIITPKNP